MHYGGRTLNRPVLSNDVFTTSIDWLGVVCLINKLMKQVRIGNVPLEWFTGVGELRSHDRACNNMTREELMRLETKVKLPFDRALVLAKRKERKEQKRLNKIGVSYQDTTTGAKCVSTNGIITPFKVKAK